MDGFFHHIQLFRIVEQSLNDFCTVLIFPDAHRHTTIYQELCIILFLSGDGIEQHHRQVTGNGFRNGHCI